MPGKRKYQNLVAVPPLFALPFACWWIITQYLGLQKNATFVQLAHLGLFAKHLWALSAHFHLTIHANKLSGYCSSFCKVGSLTLQNPQSKHRAPLYMLADCLDVTKLVLNLRIKPWLTTINSHMFPRNLLYLETTPCCDLSLYDLGWCPSLLTLILSTSVREIHGFSSCLQVLHLRNSVFCYRFPDLLSGMTTLKTISLPQQMQLSLLEQVILPSNLQFLSLPDVITNSTLLNLPTNLTCLHIPCSNLTQFEWLHPMLNLTQLDLSYVTYPKNAETILHNVRTKLPNLQLSLRQT